MSNEIEIKTQRIVSMLSELGREGVLLNSQHNFAWFTGGASNGIDLSRDPGAASILVTCHGKRYLLTNNIEMQRMLDEQVSSDLFEPVEYSWRADKESPTFVIDTAKNIADGDVAADTAIEGSIAQCRYSLTDEEIERYRTLGSDASAVFDQMASVVSPGMTENEIANCLRAKLGERGISPVVTLVAADERIAKYRHPLPTNSELRTTVMLVACAKRGGLIVNLSRIFSIGEPSSELVDRTASTAIVNAALIGVTTDGTNGSDLYRAAAEQYEKLGFADEIDRHHQGGATGYRTRDWVAHPACVDVVFDRQAFAWNPTITGTKVEDTHILINGQMDCITASNDFPTIETVVNGRRIISHGILTV